MNQEGTSATSAALTRVDPRAQNLTATVQASSALLTRAFIDDPAVVHADADRTRRLRWLPVLYWCTARYALRAGGMQVVGVSASALWLENEIEAPFWKSLWSGFWRIPFAAGIWTTLKLMRHESWCASRVKALCGKRYGYIWILGVEPEVQRSGYGRKAVLDAEREMSALGHEVCVLKTENPANVAYYEHIGFECIDTQVVPPSGLQYWLFRKRLAAAPPPGT